jgi:3-oxoacyl-[acyl-carrier-protein] synthase II
MTVRITGHSVHIPGGDEPACTAEDAAAVLGRKGLLFKEPATRLALCAVHRALGLPAGVRPKPELSPTTAVVACGNLGNVATVADVVGTVRTEGGRHVSPLAAPNASSNVIASTVAIWFGFGGPNLMICSGANAGVDGLRLARLLLRAGRADRVVLVGAEPADPVATGLYGAPLTAGAACVILERAEPATPPADRPAVALGPSTVDCYGARDVVELARAARLVASGGAGWVALTRTDPRFGPAPVRWATVHAGADQPILAMAA